jgi:putative N-acetyltransferase (TIGR04045 family)
MNELVLRVAQNEEELWKCFEIRRKIFLEEQRMFDGSDVDEHDGQAVHIVAIREKEIVGTVRVYPDGDGTWYGGRLAVLQAHRGFIGARLVRKAVEVVKEKGARRFYAHVQDRNIRFFMRLGWRPLKQVQMHGRTHELMEIPV